MAIQPLKCDTAKNRALMSGHAGRAVTGGPLRALAKAITGQVSLGIESPGTYRVVVGMLGGTNVAHGNIGVFL